MCTVRLSWRRALGTPEAAILHVSLIIDSYRSCSITLGGGGRGRGGWLTLRRPLRGPSPLGWEVFGPPVKRGRVASLLRSAAAQNFSQKLQGVFRGRRRRCRREFCVWLIKCWLKKNTHKTTIASLYQKKKKVGLDSCQDNSCVPIPSTIEHFVRCTNHDVGSFVLLPFAISGCGRVTVALFVCVPWNQTLFFVPLFLKWWIKKKQ